MKQFDRTVFNVSYIVLLVCLALTINTDAIAQSEWVRYGQDGLLKYQRDSRGDRILDFSSAGYRGGEEIPVLETVIESQRFVNVSPIAGDNLAHIQAAIDQVSAFPLNANGFRGVVDLGPGEYPVNGTIEIEASGVVVRGAGDGASVSSNTIIRATSTSQINVFSVNSPQHNFHDLNASSSRIQITDKVVPAGSSSFNVANSSIFQVGDAINVYRDSNQAWLDSLSPPEPWLASEQRFDHQQERKIVRIEGNRLFLDVPLAHSIDAREATGEVFRYTDRRIENVGFQGLRGVSDFDSSETEIVQGTLQYVDEDHADSFISIGRAKNSWAKEITGQHFIDSTVSIGSVSRSITIDDSHSIDPVSLVEGGRRYSFNFNGGQYLLGKNLTSDQGRHSFVNNTTFGGFNRGPSVFYNAVATNALSGTGPHQKYSTGTLYDNVTDDYKIEARYTIGANHGWTGANHVFWNNTAGVFEVRNPPGARNFLIGGVGPLQANNDGTVDSHGQRVTFNDPQNPLDSLYIAQKLEKERFPNYERREYTVGDFDELEDDGIGSQDEVYVDLDWLSAIDNLSSSFHSGQQVGAFDNDVINRKVPFSFAYDLATNEEIVSATLTIATKRYGTHSDNDLIWIDSTSNPMTFGQMSDWGPIYDGDLQVLNIEFYGDLAFLEDGLLNVVVSDDRAVDWAHLELVVGPLTTIPGDFNSDGQVDAADFTVWRDSYNSEVELSADANRNGIIDDGDYNVWLANFGQSSLATAISVPEPSGLMIVFSLVFSVPENRKRQARMHCLGASQEKLSGIP